VELFIVEKGTEYEGSNIEGVYASETEALAHVRDNQPKGFGDDYINISVHQVGVKGRGRVIHMFQSYSTQGRKWKALRSEDGSLLVAKLARVAEQAAVAVE